MEKRVIECRGVKVSITSDVGKPQIALQMENSPVIKLEKDQITDIATVVSQTTAYLSRKRQSEILDAINSSLL